MQLCHLLSAKSRTILRLRTISVRYRPYATKIKTDEYAIPLRPTWSVTELLSSYPKPAVSSKTLIRLHELAALVPPAEGTAEHVDLQKEISELVRLVEAVRLIDTQGVSVATRWDREDADKRHEIPEVGPQGQELLEHAARTHDGFYVVDTDRKRGVVAVEEAMSE
ncbi:hypothetical protein Agabi119p4_4703 [Agaricus bisporus var. burnettii]|uniref:Glutamyl-tRNA(Gln) amidotransferase subunit F, mitochondrial n=2 Tax=Agaricus bisporus var. burnettii TaxID=192524 RepID=A0A8H7KHJ3_AGABI|nr:hypothetical protein Agabi119p4_4703 [Agaricus bisporus var. burnettii]